MFDVALFEIVRSSRRADPTAEEKLVLAGPLIDEIGELFSAGSDLDSQPTQDALGAFRRSHRDLLEFTDGCGKPGSAVQYALTLLGDLDRWLLRQNDMPQAADLVNKLKALEQAYAALCNDTPWRTALTEAFRELSEWVLYWIAHDDTLDKVSRGTRMALVAALAGWPQVELAKLQPVQIGDLLNRRIPLFPEKLARLFPKARVQLVREASVADLHVVRSEWRCYVPGEIASIRNVMAGESFRNEQKQLREQETTVAQEEETLRREERTDEQQQQSDLSREISTQLQAQVSGFFRFEKEGGEPTGRYKISGGADGGLAISHSERQAARIARQAVSRAVTNVESRTRQSRLQRTLARSEDTTEYKLENDSENHRRGVYRWVDRIDRYQVFRYPNRLQLEFELPEPAEYYRWRKRESEMQNDKKAPPPWDLKEQEITDNAKAIDLAVKYRASNLPVLPDNKVSIVQVLAGSPEKDTLPNNGTVQWKAPEVIKDLEIAVPDGYQATKVTYSGMATAARAVWHREQTGHPGDDDLEGFHSIWVNVLVGSSNAGYLKGGRFAANLDDTNTVQQWGGQAQNKVQYGEAMLNIVDENGAAVSQTLTPGAIQKLKVGFHAVGVATVAMTFIVECVRSEERRAAWQHAVYDALFAAWSEWNSEWEAAQTRQALTRALPQGESSGARNVQNVRDELKRQVIAWLLDESPFQGRNGLQPLPVGGDGKPQNTWREIDFAKARGDAAIIQFFEQAFEWANMTYIFYPYYWAGRDRWDELANLEGVDPDFERFLKAGSARVVVPARPGMEAAVHHWLVYQEPFMGQPMPLPGEKMYVSIATEIRDLTRPPEGGIPGESWETRLGTTLVWLDDSANLPMNPLGRLGAPPNEPKDILCVDANSIETGH